MATRDDNSRLRHKDGKRNKAMRLIDADVLNETLDKYKGNFVQYSCTDETTYPLIDACVAIDIAQQCVNNAPTIYNEDVYVVKDIDTGKYWKGYNGWTDQLRLARMYCNYKYANETINRFKEKNLKVLHGAVYLDN